MNSIVVSNIPTLCSRNDLMHHFSNPKYGGGAVAYILHPLGTDYTRAVIEFEDASVVEKACIATHDLYNTVLRVRPVPRQPINRCTAEVDPLVVSSIPDIHLCIENLETNYGITAEFSKEGKLVLVGTLLQIQNAQCKLEVVFKEQQEQERKELEKLGHHASSVITPRSSQGNLSREEIMRELDKQQRSMEGPGGTQILQSLPAMHLSSGRAEQRRMSQESAHSSKKGDTSSVAINDLGTRSPAVEPPFTVQAQAVNEMFASMSDSIRADASVVEKEESKYQGLQDSARSQQSLSLTDRHRRISDPESMLQLKASDVKFSTLYEPHDATSTADRLARSLDYRHGNTSSWKKQPNLEKARETVKHKTHEWQFSSMDLEDSNGDEETKTGQKISRVNSRDSDNPLYQSGHSLQSHRSYRSSDQADIDENEGESHVQVDVDPNVLDYVRKIHKPTIEEIKQAHHVIIQYRRGDGIAHVRFVPVDTKADDSHFTTEQAKDEFVSLYQSVFFSVVQETIEFDPHKIHNYKLAVESVKEVYAGRAVIRDKIPGEIIIVGKWGDVSNVAEYLKGKLGLKKRSQYAMSSSQGLRSEYVMDSGTDKPKLRLVMTSSGAEDTQKIGTVESRNIDSLAGRSYLSQTAPAGGLDRMRKQPEGSSDLTSHDALMEAQVSSLMSQHRTQPSSLSQSSRAQHEQRESRYLQTQVKEPQSTAMAPTQDEDSQRRRESAQEDLSKLREHFSPRTGPLQETREWTSRASRPVEETRFSFTTDQGLSVSIYTQDITTVPVDVIVCPSNGSLDNIGGLARAITVAAGDGYQELCTEYVVENGPLKVTEVASIPARGNLSCHDVIHAVGPIWTLYTNKDKCAADLCRTFTNSFKYASVWLKASSIAVPAISTGLYSVPEDVCARALFEAIQAFSYDMHKDTHLREIHLANLDEDTTAMFSAIFSQLIETGHHLEAPATGGYDSDVSEGSAAINLDLPAGSKAARRKRRSHTRPPQADREDGASPPPTSQENLASIEQRYERQASDLEERASNVSYGSMAIYPETDQPDPPMSSLVLRDMEQALPGSGDLTHSPALSSTAAKRLGNLDDFLSGLDGETANTTVKDSVEAISGNKEQTSIQVPATSPRGTQDSMQKYSSPSSPAPANSQHHSLLQTQTDPTLNTEAQEHQSHMHSQQADAKPILSARDAMRTSLTASGKSAVAKKRPFLGGQMDWEVNRKISLEGQEGTGVIVVIFSFPVSAALAEPLIETIYLPNSVEGRQVLLLMKKAFDAHLLFRVEDRTLVLNGVEVKKSTSGGIMGNGYPDPEYINRVRQQLLYLGVSADD